MKKKRNGTDRSEMYYFRFGKYKGKLLDIIKTKNACVLGKFADSEKYLVCDSASLRGAYIDCIGGVEFDSLLDAKHCYRAFSELDKPKKTVNREKSKPTKHEQAKSENSEQKIIHTPRRKR